MMVTRHHHLPVLKELVRAGANLNLQNKVTIGNDCMLDTYFLKRAEK